MDSGINSDIPDDHLSLVAGESSGIELERKWNVLLIASFSIMVIVLLMAVVAAPAIYASWRNTSDLTENNELVSCRSLVRSSVDDASINFDILTSKQDHLIGQVVEKILAQDLEGLYDLLEEFPQVRGSVDIATDNLKTAIENYRVAAQQSLESPGDFLKTCKE